MNKNYTYCESRSVINRKKKLVIYEKFQQDYFDEILELSYRVDFPITFLCA